MKKFKKIKLHNTGSIMKETEMKMIVGGYSDPLCYQKGAKNFSCVAYFPTQDFGYYYSTSRPTCGTSVEDAQNNLKNYFPNVSWAYCL